MHAIVLQHLEPTLLNRLPSDLAIPATQHELKIGVDSLSDDQCCSQQHTTLKTERLLLVDCLSCVLC